MTINDKVRDAKLQYDNDRKAAHISELSSGKIDKHEYLPDEEILLSNQTQTIQQAKLTYFLSGNALEKQTKKKVDALKSSSLSNEINQ